MRRFPLLLAAALMLSSCSLPGLDLPRDSAGPDSAQPARPLAQAYGPPLPDGATVEEPGEQEPREINTWDITGSLRPEPGEVNLEETIPRIMERGRIIVGVDQSQNLLSYRDGVTGELRGFEVDLAREFPATSSAIPTASTSASSNPPRASRRWPTVKST